MSERIDKIISGIRLAKPDYVVGLDLAEELCAYIEQQRQENAKLREEIDLYEAMKEGVSVRVSDLEAENASLRAELSTLRQTAPYRVENQQPATVEQDEWRSV